jgi:hypothetical protein
MDQRHSLRAVADMVCADGVYSALFKGDPDYFGGNWLTQGNLDAFKKEPGVGLDVIDIRDFAVFAGQYLATPDPNAYCANKHDGPHADINGDGVVNGLDFAFIMRNFLEHSKDSCCPDGIGGVDVGLTEISVRDLPREQRAADINGDGLVNTDDMAAFMNGNAPEAQKRQGRSPNLRGSR